jgi:hypothetical protein
MSSSDEEAQFLATTLILQDFSIEAPSLKQFGIIMNKINKIAVGDAMCLKIY